MSKTIDGKKEKAKGGKINIFSFAMQGIQKTAEKMKNINEKRQRDNYKKVLVCTSCKAPLGMPGVTCRKLRNGALVCQKCYDKIKKGF